MPENKNFPTINQLINIGSFEKMKTRNFLNA